jgi:AraC-like DNA-binding protein
MAAAGSSSVSSILIRALVDAAERGGVGRAALLEGSPFHPRRLEAAVDRFDRVDFERLQLRALDLTGDEALGLHMAERASEAALDLVAHLAAHAPTLRDAVDLCSRFERLLIDGAHLRLRERRSVATIQLELVRTSPRADRMLAEFAMAGLERLVSVFGGPGALTSAVYFEYPAPAHRREYARMFNGAERFGQSLTGLEFDAAILDRRQLHQHSTLSMVLRDQAQQQLERLGHVPGLPQLLEEYLLARAPSRIPDMETAARELGISARSLRRRLSEQRISYRALVQSTLESSAKHMLRDPRRSLQETACALGFADAAAFHRAFKRWTGLTPQEFRHGKEAG